MKMPKDQVLTQETSSEICRDGYSNVWGGQCKLSSMNDSESCRGELALKGCMTVADKYFALPSTWDSR